VLLVLKGQLARLVHREIQDLVDLSVLKDLQASKDPLARKESKDHPVLLVQLARKGIQDL
jgi:hypothetical protein